MPSRGSLTLCHPNKTDTPLATELSPRTAERDGRGGVQLHQGGACGQLSVLNLPGDQVEHHGRTAAVREDVYHLF